MTCASVLWNARPQSDTGEYLNRPRSTLVPSLNFAQHPLDIGRREGVLGALPNRLQFGFRFDHRRALDCRHFLVGKECWKSPGGTGIPGPEGTPAGSLPHLVA